MTAWRSLSLVGVATVVIGLAAPPASAEHLRSSGAVYGGVANEQEARSYPCPEVAAGGWERTGPVVCLAKQAEMWALKIEDDRGCTYDATGYRGSCVFDVDMGDHVRIWGGRGIPYTSFIVDWGHPPVGESDVRKPAGGEASGGSAGPSSGTTTEPRPAGPAPPGPPPPAAATYTGPAAVGALGAAPPGVHGSDRGGGAPSQQARGVPDQAALATGPADSAAGGGGHGDSSDIKAENDTPSIAIAAGALLLGTLSVVLTHRLVRRRHHRGAIS